MRDEHEFTEERLQNVTSVNSSPGLDQRKLIPGITEEIIPWSEVFGYLMNPLRFASYTDTNRQLINYLRDRQKPFTLQSLLEYIDDAAASGDRARTVNRKKCAVKRIVAELIADNPDRWTRLDQFFIDRLFRSIKGRRIQSRAIPEEKYLNTEEIDLLLNHADHRLRLIILFLITTGCRVDELITCNRFNTTIHRSDVDIVVTGKGGKERHVRISRRLHSRIETEFRGEQYLFCTRDRSPLHRQWIWRKINDLGLQHLGRKIGPHAFRHSFATLMIQAGKDLKAVSEYLGHSGTEVTADMYLHTELVLDEIPDFERRIRVWEKHPHD